LTDNWADYPLHPQPAVQMLTGKLARRFASVPSAWRSGDALFLFVSPFGDNEMGHTGAAAFSATSSLTENGKKLPLSGQPGNEEVKLNPGPGTVVYSLTATSADPLAVLSPRTTTKWTFRTSRDPSASLPRSWICANANFE